MNDPGLAGDPRFASGALNEKTKAGSRNFASNAPRISRKQSPFPRRIHLPLTGTLLGHLLQIDWTFLVGRAGGSEDGFNQTPLKSIYRGKATVGCWPSQ